MLRAMPVVSSPPSLEEGIDRYLVTVAERGLKPATIAAYRGEMRRFRGYAEGQAGVTALRDIGEVVIDTYQRSLAPGRRGGSARAQPLGQAAAERRLVVLRGFLSDAWSRGWLAEDLSTRIQLGRVPDRPPHPMTGDELQRLVVALAGTTLKDRRDRALVLLLLSTGAGLSELLRLDRRDWSHIRLILPGRRGHNRTAVVTSRARRAVEDYLEARRTTGDTSTALFIGFQRAKTGSGDNRLTAAGARHVLLAITRRAGVPPLRVMRFRDTFGTIVYRQVGDLSFAASALGYADVRSVAGYLPGPADGRRPAARKALQANGL